MFKMRIVNVHSWELSNPHVNLLLHLNLDLRSICWIFFTPLSYKNYWNVEVLKISGSSCWRKAENKDSWSKWTVELYCPNYNIHTDVFCHNPVGKLWVTSPTRFGRQLVNSRLLLTKINGIIILCMCHRFWPIIDLRQKGLPKVYCNSKKSFTVKKCIL